MGKLQDTEVELVKKPRRPTLIGNTFVIQPFLTHCSCRYSYFSKLRLFEQTEFSSEKYCYLNNDFIFNLRDQRTISGRWFVKAISVRNKKLCSKSVATCQSVQSSSNYVWSALIFMWKFRNISLFNEINRFIDDII